MSLNISKTRALVESAKRHGWISSVPSVKPLTAKIYCMDCGCVIHGPFCKVCARERELRRKRALAQ